MSYLIVYKIKSEPNNKTQFIDNISDLTEIVNLLSKSGKGIKIDIYEATKKSYKLEYDDVPKNINVKVPKIVFT